MSVFDGGAMGLDDEIILQSGLRRVPDPRRLPGTGPIAPDAWACMDDAYAAQMALRDRLIGTRRDDVYEARPDAADAEQEVLDRVVDLVCRWPGFEFRQNKMQRPDGVEIDLAGPGPALVKAGRLVQEDLCIMQDTGAGEYSLTAVLLCFPANWMLSEKLGRPLTGIHEPVDEYDENLAKRVERLFRAVRDGHPMRRYNFLAYEDPRLFTPGREAAVRPTRRKATYLRSERQCILRLPKSGAALFSIHTFMVKTSSLDQETYDAARGVIGSACEFPPRLG